MVQNIKDKIFNKDADGIKVLAFDFWGVFADLDHPMYTYIKERGMDPEKYSQSLHDLIIAHDLGQITEKEFLIEASKLIGLDLPYELCHFAFKKELMNQDLIKIAKLLKEKYKLILITNNPKEYCQRYLFETKLNELFQDLIISYEVGVRKPAKEMYELLIKRAGVSSNEILFIDDDPSKFEVAEKLGIKTLQYRKIKTNQELKDMINEF